MAVYSAFGDVKEAEVKGIKRLYQQLEKGYNSMPLDFPGTRFHQAMKVEGTFIYFHSIKDIHK